MKFRQDGTFTCYSFAGDDWQTVHGSCPQLLRPAAMGFARRAHDAGELRRTGKAQPRDRGGINPADRRAAVARRSGSSRNAGRDISGWPRLVPTCKRRRPRHPFSQALPVSGRPWRARLSPGDALPAIRRSSTTTSPKQSRPRFTAPDCRRTDPDTHQANARPRTRPGGQAQPRRGRDDSASASPKASRTALPSCRAAGRRYGHAPLPAPSRPSRCSPASRR